MVLCGFSTYLVMSVWGHGHLFNALDYKATLYFVAQIVQVLVSRLFCWVLCTLGPPASFFPFHFPLPLFLFLLPPSLPSFSSFCHSKVCAFPASALESAISPRNCGPFEWKMVLETKLRVLDIIGVHCDWESFLDPLKFLIRLQLSSSLHGFL